MTDKVVEFALKFVYEVGIMKVSGMTHREAVDFVARKSKKISAKVISEIKADV